MKKSLVYSGIIAAVLLLAGCSNTLSNSSGGTSGSSGGSDSIPEDFKVAFSEVLESSQDFIKKSISSAVPLRAAVTPSEADKWEGRIKYQNGNWNVPSYFYGTTPGETLVVNGEDLGKLQDLHHLKDGAGHYTKAAFIYKDKLYYVFDKSAYTKSDNDSYIVLASEDDVDHIVFDQKDKINTPEFSNFKFWVWERDLSNTLYRTGGLGYAYTLRNVEMPDGSYANITVAGYNYYYYGFRVWIKETDGKSVKIDYPQSAPYEFTSSFQKGTLATVESGENFIYEIVNNTAGTLIVQNYIRDWTIEDWDLGIAALGSSYTIPAGQTHQFKYNLTALKQSLNSAIKKPGIGCYFTPQGKWQCGGWENDLNQTGKKHTVTVTPSDNSCMNGENSWGNLQ